MKQFRQDNTAGFTDSEIEEMNTEYENQTKGITNPDELKHTAELILKKY
uniref:Uncharacterized protein n=1 Tax=viral metagenome TaxID=1070528 RepID=A0A6H2A1K7_9ZZZZ